MINRILMKMIMNLSKSQPVVDALHQDAVKRRRAAWKPPADTTAKKPPEAPKAPTNPFAAAFLDLPASQRPAAMAAAHKLQADHDARTARSPRVNPSQSPATRSAAEIARIIRSSPVGVAYAGLSDTDLMAQWLEDRAMARSYTER